MSNVPLTLLSFPSPLPLQTCPTSSVYTKSDQLEYHSIQQFCKDGVDFSLNTDDPGIINCTLTGECDVAEKRIGLTQHQIMRSVSAWCVCWAGCVCCVLC